MTKKVSSYLLFSLILLLCGCKSHKNISDYNDYNVYNEEELLQHIINNIEQTSDSKLLLDKAKEWIGTPYKYGHSEKGIATDCSGMVMVLYLEVYNIKLPRNSAKQGEFCKQISHSEVSPGDLVFFATGKNKNRISHVGIMISSTQFIHASSSKGVIISDISADYYKSRLIKFGKVPIND